MPEIETKPTLKLDSVAPETPGARPYRKRKFAFDKNEVVRYILDGVESDMAERDDRIQRRMARRAKMMGWQSPKGFPWKNCSQVFLPIIQIANLKTRGTLENAIKSIRPILSAKARQKRNAPKEDAINNVLDYQFFGENPGEDLVDSFVANFVEDEAAYLYAQWVKETQSYHDVRLLPGLVAEQEPLPQLLQLLPQLNPGHLTERMLDEEGWEWEVTYEDDQKQLKTAKVCFYETDDGMIEAHIVVDMTTHNGPTVSVEDFEDIIYPARSANLQPPTPSNPRGAAYVARLCSLSLDTIRRRKEDHTYDQITDEDWDRIAAGHSPIGAGKQDEEPKQQKDEMEGTQTSFGQKRDDRGQVVWFGRLDVNGDGLEEDVIAWVLREEKVLCKIALLTEIYPGIPIRRPFTAKAFIPITNRVAGISQSELLESLQDVMQSLMDQHVDWGTLTNTPMFFYRAASGLKSEPIHIEPGMGYPLDDPGRDVAFPTWPTKDSSFAINSITLLQQFVERISMVSDVNLGRVPVGRASALRNTGSILSLIGQGDMRSEQVLRRLFSGLSDIFGIMHRLNRRFLPEHKEVRVVGAAAQGTDAYLQINRQDMEADIDFDFKATLLNTNKEALSQALNQTVSMMIQPLLMQAGIVSVEEMYNAFHDFAKSMDLDPDRYFKKPPEAMQGPKLLAEEVISAVAASQPFDGQPEEDPMLHLQKLQLFLQSPLSGMLNKTQMMLLQQWMLKVQMAAMQQQALLQSMQQFQSPDGSGTAQSKGAAEPTGPGANPLIAGGEMIDETAKANQDRFQ
jgi:hypothetical protein